MIRHLAFWRLFQKTPDDMRRKLLSEAEESLVEIEAEAESAHYRVVYLRKRIARLKDQLALN